MATYRVTRILPLVAAFLMLLCRPALAAEQSFAEWMASFRQDAQQAGIETTLLDKAFAGMEPIERVIELDRKQPEGKWSYKQYQERILGGDRIPRGKAMLEEHRALLEKVAADYGVQPRFIVALWGTETSYGRVTGGFGIIPALATLAYDGRRAEFFRDELLKALRIVQEGHISLDTMKGSWAGAMGQCQFMPSSFFNFAVDYDGDGRKDIWNSLPDVFASIANYLSKSGWDDDLTWGRQVELMQELGPRPQSVWEPKLLPAWQEAGVRRMGGGNLPDRDIEASLVYPDENDSLTYLVYNNYNVLLKWNRSRYFATAVGELSDRLAYW